MYWVISLRRSLTRTSITRAVKADSDEEALRAFFMITGFKSDDNSIKRWCLHITIVHKSVYDHFSGLDASHAHWRLRCSS